MVDLVNGHYRETTESLSTDLDSLETDLQKSISEAFDVGQEITKLKTYEDETEREIRDIRRFLRRRQDMKIRLVVFDLKVPESSLENDIVDCASFCNNVEYEMLGKGFCEGNLMGAMVAGCY